MTDPSQAALSADELAAIRKLHVPCPDEELICCACSHLVSRSHPCVVVRLLDALALAEREIERQIAYSAALLETLLYFGTWTCANVPWHSEEVQKDIAELQDRDAATHAMLQRMAETDHQAGEWQERAENAEAALAAERALSAQLKDALARYGRHEEDCFISEGGNQCTCGWAAALSVQEMREVSG